MIVQEPVQVNINNLNEIYLLVAYNILYLLQAAIWHCLNHYDYADAVFLSERLYAEGELRKITFYSDLVLLITSITDDLDIEV